MIRRPPRSTQSRSSAASDVYKRQRLDCIASMLSINYYTDHVKVPNEWLRIGEDTGRKEERMSSMGKRLRKLRKEKRLTHTEVTGCDYSKEYVSQVALRKTTPSRKAMLLSAKHLDVDES